MVLRAIVVGGTSGIGQGIAQYLASRGCHVTIVGRSQERGSEVVEHMKKLSTQPDQAEFKFIQCDASRIRSIKEFADEYCKTHTEPVDILVLSQGIATIAGYTETAEGLEQKLAIHYYGRFFFIESLLPLLRKSSHNAKVVSILSGGVHSAYRQYQSDTDLVNNFSIKNAADAAGFYNDLSLDALSHESGNNNISFIHAGPGMVNSNWGNEMPFWLKILIRAIQPIIGRSIEATGELIGAPLLDNNLTPPGFLLRSYMQSLIGEMKPNESTTTDLHSDEAKEFMMKHTREVIQRILDTGKAR